MFFDALVSADDGQSRRVQFVRSTAEAFYLADHKILYDIILKLYERNSGVDAVILAQELAKRQLLDDVGGLPYLAQIISSVPSAAHGAHYAEIVREKALLRQLISASNDILREAYRPAKENLVQLGRAAPTGKV